MLHESMLNQSILVEDYELPNPASDYNNAHHPDKPRPDAKEDEVKSRPQVDLIKNEQEGKNDCAKDEKLQKDPTNDESSTPIDQDVSVEKQPDEAEIEDIDKLCQEYDADSKLHLGAMHKLLDDTLTSPKTSMVGLAPIEHAQDQDAQDPTESISPTGVL